MSNELAELFVSIFVLSLVFSAYITTKDFFSSDLDIDYKKYTKELNEKDAKNNHKESKVFKDDRSNDLDLSPKEFKEQIDYYSDYKLYLGSKKWKKIKRRRYIYDRGICQHCKKKVSEFSYHTHHLTYKNLYNERLEDIITVNASCHTEFHKKDIKKMIKKMIKEIVTKCIIDDEVQTYDMCSKSKDIEVGYKDTYKYIGFGKICEIDGKKYNSKKSMHFWRKKNKKG